MTHLVDHVGQKALDFVAIKRLLAAETDGSREFSHWDSSPTNGRIGGLFGLVETAGEEYLAQEVTQRDIAASLKRQIDAPLDELVFALL
jgi:hypothetical protein